ncbi:hypothetical protein Pcinc_033306 [Petrolisthes cinctipes]|uniref:Cadherin domain-containing protein n=1 Tax=Petrolisthes cinctipes TaxID=88211 RepID=A0AAE1ESE1_PETCI|nr:hypothetical protein Pcinc_033306 [Petrolisthes cinctipes]
MEACCTTSDPGLRTHQWRVPPLRVRRGPGAVRSDRKRSRVSVMLRVENTMEPPWFDNDQYSFAVSESASIDTYVGTVVARDADGDFDRYELKELTPHDHDENTNKPVFDNCSDITVKENQPAGTGVALVKATDADHGVNGEVSYSLLNDDPTFTIETRDGYGHIFTTRVCMSGSHFSTT